MRSVAEYYDKRSAAMTFMAWMRGTRAIFAAAHSRWSSKVTPALWHASE